MAARRAVGAVLVALAALGSGACASDRMDLSVDAETAMAEPVRALRAAVAGGDYGAAEVQLSRLRSIVDDYERRDQLGAGRADRIRDTLDDIEGEVGDLVRATTTTTTTEPVADDEDDDEDEEKKRKGKRKGDDD